MNCRTCKTEQGENFRPRRKQCKSCDSAAQRDRYAANPEVHRKRSQVNRQERKDAILAANRQYRRDNPEKAREWGRRAKRKANGWEPGRFEAALVEQGGLCAVIDCGRPAAVADHCHQSGRARAALCSGCNKALGLLADDPARIAGLAQYMLRHANPDERQNTMLVTPVAGSSQPETGGSISPDSSVTLE